MAATVAKTFHVSNDSPSEFPSSQEPLQALGDDNKKWYMWFEHRHVFDNNGFWANYCFGSGRMRRRRNWRSWHHLKHLAAKSTMKTMDRCERQQGHPFPDRRAMTWIQSWKRRKMSTKSWSKGPGSPGGLATPSWWGARAEIRQTGEKPSATGTAISTTQKIKTERQSILEAFKGKICKTGWQARALQGGGPGVTLLPVVLQGDLPVWAISIAVSAGSLGSEGELVCALFAVDCFWDYRWRDQWPDPEVYRQSATICIEGVCQEKWKGPLDGERQPVQPEYTHAGPALHTELLRHRRTWCAILRSLEVTAPSKRQGC